MVRTLQECCLAYVARHISSYPRLGNGLTRTQKERLLERICWHGLLCAEVLPAVSYNLFSHSLKRINLAHCTQVDDAVLAVLGSSGCLPISLTIDSCPAITDKGVSSLVRILHKLEEVHLRGLRHLTGEEAFGNIRSRALKCARLHTCSAVSDRGLALLVLNCPNIERLSLCHLHKLTDVAIIKAAEVLGSKLMDLDCSQLSLITSLSTKALAKYCRNLTSASFDSCVRLDGSGLVEMAEHCSLSALCVSFCYKLPAWQGEVLVSLLRARGCLLRLELMAHPLSSLALEMLASMSSLTRLSLCGVQTLTDQGVELVTATTGGTLEEFDVSHCSALGEESCCSIARHCQCIEVLRMMNLKSITGAGLLPLFQDQRANHIRSITLSGSKNVKSSVVQAIAAHSPNLETITVAGLQDISDDVVLSIAFNCHNLLQISLRNCGVADAGVCALSLNCPKLRVLALSGVHCLTDKCVMMLADHCHLLEELYLSGCSHITKQAITYLKDCVVANLYVEHQTPNAPFGQLMAKDLDTGDYTRVDHIQFPPLPASK